MADYPCGQVGPSAVPASTAMLAITTRTDSAAAPGDDRAMSVEISGLIKAIQKHGPVRTVQAHLQRLTKGEKALHVVRMLNIHQQQGEVLAVIVSHVWENYVIPEKLWEHYEGGESRFKEDVAYHEFIEPALESVKESQSRKDRYISRLESKWGPDWEKIIDLSTDHQSLLSEHYLRNMARLAGNGMALLDAKLALQHAVKRRISNPGKGVRARKIIMVSDIQQVVSAVSAVSQIHNIKTEQCTLEQLFTYLDDSAHLGRQAAELETSRTTQDAARTVISTLSRRSSFAVQNSSKTPSPGVHAGSALARGVTGDAVFLDVIGHVPCDVPEAGPAGLINPMPGQAGLQSNALPCTPRAQLVRQKRSCTEATSETHGVSKPYVFRLSDDWAERSPVRTGLCGRGFYTSSDVPQFANGRCPAAIVNELSIYRHFTEPSDDIRLRNCIHSLLQQALVQNPCLYLTALAAMETTNYRLISLPTPLTIFHTSDDSKLMDPTFPFMKCIENDKTVPATRILYSLDDANLRIGTSLHTKKQLKGWWDMSGGNLEVAATQLPLEEFSTARLLAGEFIVIPPQLLWYVESNYHRGGAGSAAAWPSRFVEVRYISVTQEGELDIDYWPYGTYRQISRLNRDLLAPTAHGWYVEPAIDRRRFQGAIEMRGIWAIGDALLGLMSWDSPLVQLELRQLFDVPPGDWLNRKFVEDVQTSFDRKLASMVETLKSVHQQIFA